VYEIRFTHKTVETLFTLSLFSYFNFPQRDSFTVEALLTDTLVSRQL